MKKLTTEEWIEKAKLVHGVRYDYSKVRYIGTHKKVCIICPIHGEFWQTPKSHSKGIGCSKCGGSEKLTKEEFVEKAKLVHGDRYDYSQVAYNGSHKKVCVICKEHGEFWQTPTGHLAGRGCSKCGGSKKLTKEEFIEKAKKVHGDKYEYSEVKYINNSTKVCIICPKHDKFEQTPSNHLKGKGCPKCVGRNKTTEEWIEKTKQVHEDRYDYSKVRYIGTHKKVCIICPIHGEFLQTPKNHSKGIGCPKCGGSEKLTKEEFIEKAKQVHGDRYDYSKVVYENARRKVIVICPEHGEFLQTPTSHLDNKGCPKCSNNYRYSTIEWIDEAKKVHEDRYDYSKVEYKNARRQVCIICPTHGEFMQIPDIHLSGCGCPICSESKLEKETAKLLKQHGIKYEREKKYVWLKHKQPLFLDFYLPEYNIAIECQGIQHFEPVRFGSITIDKANKNLKYLQNNDRIKKQLCVENNLPLYYINYDDIVEGKLNEIISKYKTR